ncbi:MAG: efflux RND transporter periplasmic adaptor subunit [Propionivibrio sp.]
MKTIAQRNSFISIALCAALFVGQASAAEELPTVVATPHPVNLTLPFEATVEATTQTTLTSQVSGRVVDMQVDIGQPVHKGDLLLRIDAREASEMAAGATAQYVNAKANYDRLKNLHQQKFISGAALDKARAELDAAQAARGQASVNVGLATVTAPISGLVAQRLIEQGETAAPGRALLTVYDPNGLRATASIPQYQLPQIRNVKQARIEFPELGQWADSKFVTLLPTADAATHVSQVRVGLPDDLPGVVPGMFARVHFVLGNAVRLTVPASAIVRRGEVAAVYVKTDQDALALRQLRLGERLSEGDVEVLAGLSEGERVVLDAVRAGIELKARQIPAQKK